MADQIAHSRSCADVHNQTKQHPHCGRCSQCIDRRFAILAAGLEAHDPEDAYRLDLMTGVRMSGPDKEVALSYVRAASGYQTMTAAELERYFPVVVNAINHLDGPRNTALQRLAELLRRHGTTVSDVMRNTMKEQRPEQFPQGSLPAMLGDILREHAFPISDAFDTPIVAEAIDKTFELVFDLKRRTLLIDDKIEIKGAAYELLLVLANENLLGAGKGLVKLDYPTLPAGELCDRLGLETEEAVRRGVLRARSTLKKKFMSAGLDAEKGIELIENLPGFGYRLAPDKVAVRMKPER
ncbi:hypothetical protein [Pseudohalocynthiibacter sp. F2068]|jgi:hypothetical protein|uniref:hypothetical protein n=1 Tax=Pseudohalocynthiibacter sp. F2068 TaxID=2926418 RepID=UPI001FF45E37|nr:hypothetical protein [Pseudohalocynthiibacter sp. F2068]MCK0103442.1 hypothetical protein [Pseudohalocynthiibacter sp. F2068]